VLIALKRPFRVSGTRTDWNLGQGSGCHCQTRRLALIGSRIRWHGVSVPACCGFGFDICTDTRADINCT
jgi:hypothetical protein